MIISHSQSQTKLKSRMLASLFQFGIDVQKWGSAKHLPHHAKSGKRLRWQRMGWKRGQQSVTTDHKHASAESWALSQKNFQGWGKVGQSRLVN